MHGHKNPEVTVIYKPAGICRNPKKVLEFYRGMEWGVLSQSYLYFKRQGGLSTISSGLQPLYSNLSVHNVILSLENKLYHNWVL